TPQHPTVRLESSSARLQQKTSLSSHTSSQETLNGGTVPPLSVNNLVSKRISTRTKRAVDALRQVVLHPARPVIFHAL
ncbi:MAG TPA: hypothetical protein PK098_12035, partial [Phycisphaerales bacterium]|nr:hypothetical protein [Phycisphaerales bacterium]